VGVIRGSGGVCNKLKKHKLVALNARAARNRQRCGETVMLQVMTKSASTSAFAPGKEITTRNAVVKISNIEPMARRRQA